MELKKLLPKLDPRIAGDLRDQKRPIIIGLICSGLAALLSTSTIKLSGVAGDSVAAIHDAKIVGDQLKIASSLHELALACLAVVIIFGFRYFLVKIQIKFLSQAASALSANLRRKLVHKLLRLPVSYFTDRKAGAIQSVVTNDVNVYQNAINLIQDSISGPLRAIAAFLTILFIQPLLAIFAIALIPVMVVIFKRNSTAMSLAQAAAQNDIATLTATTNESLQGVRVLKAFGAEDQVLNLYERQNQKALKSQQVSIATFSTFRPMVEFIGAVTLAVLLYGGGLIATHGSLTSGSIIALAVAMDQINQGFKTVGGISNTLASVTAASDRIYEQILNVPEESESTKGNLRLPTSIGKIEFVNVSFQYPDGTQALHQVSFVLDPGTSLALVGPSGSGKSTIADLILRFYDPTEGSILYDGVDILEIDRKWLRKQFGIVPQQTFLFAGSIEENVKVGTPGASDKEISDALKAAHATEFSTEMQTRSSSELGERGAKLSGGQMQRVAIARAFVRKPTVLILDEATSALDAASETAISETLDELMIGRTTLMIAHRLTTAARANKILYLKQGRVVEYGTHSSLLAQNGEYAALFKLFSGGILVDTF